MRSCSLYCSFHVFTCEVLQVYVEQDSEGHVKKQICRVRVFFLSFLTGMPSVELGVNDMTRMGLEVVGRYDSVLYTWRRH